MAETKNVLILKVALKMKKSVWRRIAIREDQTLHALFHAINEAFDWDFDHLYSFFITGVKNASRKRIRESPRYSHPSCFEEPDFFDSGSFGQDASRTSIGSLELAPKMAFEYLFDFGDEWWHVIIVERIEPADPETRYPLLLESHGGSFDQYS